MHRGGEHRHICADFRDDAGSGKSLDTRSRCNDVDLREILLSGSQNQRLQVQFAQFQGIYVGTDDAELFSLFSTHLSVHSSLDLLHRGLDAFGEVRGYVKGFAAFQQPGCNSGGRFAKDIGKHIVQFDIGNCQTVLGTVLLPSGEVGQFPVIAHQIPKLANISWRDKTAAHQIVLEDVRNLFGIFLVCFLPSNRLDIFGVRQDDGAGSLQNIVNRCPILPCGFHAHVLAVIFGQPCSIPPQIVGVGGKPLTFVGGNTAVIGCGNTGHHRGFVDIHPTAYGVNDFEHNTSPQNDI